MQRPLLPEFLLLPLKANTHAAHLALLLQIY